MVGDLRATCHQIKQHIPAAYKFSSLASITKHCCQIGHKAMLERLFKETPDDQLIIKMLYWAAKYHKNEILLWASNRARSLSISDIDNMMFGAARSRSVEQMRLVYEIRKDYIDSVPDSNKEYSSTQCCALAWHAGRSGSISACIEAIEITDFIDYHYYMCVVGAIAGGHADLCKMIFERHSFERWEVENIFGEAVDKDQVEIVKLALEHMPADVKDRYIEHCVPFGDKVKAFLASLK